MMLEGFSVMVLNDLKYGPQTEKRFESFLLI